MRGLFFTLVFAGATGLQSQAPVRYRLESRTTTKVEFPAELLAAMSDGAPAGVDAAEVMNGMADKPVSTIALVRITTRDSAGGILLHLVVDSISSNQFASLDPVRAKLPPEMLEMVGVPKGGTLDLYYVKGHQSQTRTSPQMNVAMNGMTAFLPLLFPVLRANIKAGDAWSDTAAATPAAGTAPPELAGVITTSPAAPLVTRWRAVSADSIENEISASSSVGMGQTVSLDLSTAGKSSIAFDARKSVRAATSEVVSTTRTGMGEIGAVATIITNNLTVTRLPERP